jgi:hypothetical protein
MIVRHLVQLFLTIDGNHHLNKTTKNDDPFNISLMDGLAYFGKDSDLKEHVTAVEKTKEKGKAKRSSDEVAIMFISNLHSVAYIRTTFCRRKTASTSR